MADAGAADWSVIPSGKHLLPRLPELALHDRANVSGRAGRDVVEEGLEHVLVYLRGYPAHVGRYLLSILVVKAPKGHVDIEEGLGVLVVERLKALLLLLWGYRGEDGGEDLWELFTPGFFELVGYCGWDGYLVELFRGREKRGCFVRNC